MSLHLSLSMNGNKTEGVGAMMMYPIMLSFVCKLFNTEFSFSGIKNLSHFEYTEHAEDCDSWSESFEKFFNFPRLENPDKVINQLSFNQNLINFIEQNRNVNEEILIELPQDGASWAIQQFCEQNHTIVFKKESIDELRNNLKFEGEKYFNEDEVNIAIHIRSENPKDVDASSSDRELYNLDRDFPRYVNLIDRLKKKFYNKKIVTHIYSQGFVSDFKNFLDLTTDLFEIQLHIDDHPVNDLYHMINADILFMANSGFSYIASLLRSDNTYVRDNFWCFTYPTTIKVDYNFNIPL
jgi:hypothetical protein